MTIDQSKMGVEWGLLSRLARGFKPLVAKWLFLLNLKLVRYVMEMLQKLNRQLRKTLGPKLLGGIYFSVKALILSLLVFNTTHAQDQSLKKQSKDKGTISTNHSHVEFGSGIGYFQDIQVPVDDIYDLRADGTQPAAEENTDHAGFPLYVRLRLGYPISKLVFDTHLEALHMATIDSVPGSRSASYSRFGLALGSHYQFQTLFLPTLSGQVVARRSLFQNVSSGHYLDTIMPRLQSSIELWRNSIIELFAGISAYTKFDYDPGSDFKGSGFPGSHSNLQEYGVSYHYVLSEQARISFGVEQESATVVIDNVRAYNEYGLNLTKFTNEGRTYNLNTTLYKIGLIKTW